jgi:ribose transport system permease protein
MSNTFVNIDIWPNMSVKLRRMSNTFLNIDIWPIMLSIVVVLVVFGLRDPRFLSVQNLVNVFRNSSYLIIIATGQMLVLVIGGFDLSVGSVVALSSITTALTMIGSASLFPGQTLVVILIGIVCALVVGSMVGLLNGVSVALFDVPAFIVTLATMSIASGVALYITQGVPIYGMPAVFTHGFGRTKILGLPLPIHVTGLIVIAVWFTMNWTRLGRQIYAIGGNRHAARVSGIPVTSRIIVTYILSSLLAAMSGILLTARVGSGEGTMGAPFILDSIAAAVLGGVSLRGGIGKVQFVAVGAVFLSLVTNGLNIMRVDSKLQTIIIGVILILAVALDRLRRKD